MGCCGRERQCGGGAAAVVAVKRLMMARMDEDGIDIFPPGGLACDAEDIKSRLVLCNIKGTLRVNKHPINIIK